MLVCYLFVSHESIEKVALSISAAQLNLYIAFVDLFAELVTADVHELLNDFPLAGTHGVPNYECLMTERVVVCLR
jgi:hypothetical protein